MGQNNLGMKEGLSLLVLSVLWGGSFFFVEIALKGFSPFTIVFFRVASGAILLWALCFFLKRGLPKERTVWVSFLVMGLLNNVIPFSLIVWGQTRISGGQASILNVATPFMTVITAHYLTEDEKISPHKMAGVLLGFAGVAVLIGPKAARGGAPMLWGQLAVLGATLSYAFAAVWGRRFRNRGIPPLSAATGQLTCSAVILLPLSVIIDKPWNLPPPGGDVWAALLGLALLSTAFAYVLYFRILASSGATNVLLVTLLIPVSALLLGTLFLHETVSLRQISGIGIIGLGLVILDGRFFRNLLSGGTIHDGAR